MPVTVQREQSQQPVDPVEEADVTGITRPITKHNYLVKKVEDLPRVIKEAFHIARTGRPGPVVVDIPKDVSLKTTPATKMITQSAWSSRAT